jgi:segregation and condensation protein B
MGKREIIEALVFSASGSLPVKDIIKILPGSTDQEIEGLVEELNHVYEGSGRSFRIEPASQGYIFVTLPEYAHHLKQLHDPVRLSSSALEVLAVIAYKGPCSKQTIDGIRGVDSGSCLKQLLKHQIVDIKSGKPMMYHTNEKFLEVFGLTSLSDLPDIREFEEIFGDPSE